MSQLKANAILSTLGKTAEFGNGFKINKPSMKSLPQSQGKQKGNTKNNNKTKENSNKETVVATATKSDNESKGKKQETSNINNEKYNCKYNYNYECNPNQTINHLCNVFSPTTTKKSDYSYSYKRNSLSNKNSIKNDRNDAKIREKREALETNENLRKALENFSIFGSKELNFYEIENDYNKYKNNLETNHHNQIKNSIQGIETWFNDEIKCINNITNTNTVNLISNSIIINNSNNNNGSGNKDITAWDLYQNVTKMENEKQLENEKKRHKNKNKNSDNSNSIEIDNIEDDDDNDEGCLNRLKTGVPDFDYGLGGGLYFGHIYEICGLPGIGKTQLAMQLACNLQLYSDKAQCVYIGMCVIFFILLFYNIIFLCLFKFA